VEIQQLRHSDPNLNCNSQIATNNPHENFTIEGIRLLAQSSVSNRLSRIGYNLSAEGLAKEAGDGTGPLQGRVGDTLRDLKRIIVHFWSLEKRSSMVRHQAFSQKVFALLFVMVSQKHCLQRLMFLLIVLFCIPGEFNSTLYYNSSLTLRS
jgi:hypothetical protein